MFARAEKHCVFALVCGEFEILYRRANAVRPYDIIKHQYDKLKFAQQFGVERVWAAICRMQCVTHWLSAHADKLKFERK